MGTFLSLSGVINGEGRAVERSIGSFAASHGGVFEPRDGTFDDPDIAIVTTSVGNTTVLYPQHFIGWDELSKHLSIEFHAPVFSLHIHDGDLWMFILFDKGEKVTQFNPLPDYWEELEPEEKANWLCDVHAICQRLPD